MDTTVVKTPVFTQLQSPILPDIQMASSDGNIIRNAESIDPGGVKIEKNELNSQKPAATDSSQSREINKGMPVEKKFINSSVPQMKSMIPMKMLPFNKFSSLTVTPPFVLKLCSMLSTKEFEHLITWGKNEDTVLVKDLVQFSSVVLPKYFKHRNFTSFLRQLNMYGFHTLRQGENWREFKNDLFRKNGSHDYDKIKRKTAQTTGSSGKGVYESKSNTLKSSIQGGIKDSRKRKKDVFKRKGDQETKELLSKQADLIQQLMRRCEANEERIESLQEEMLSMKRQILQLKKDKTSEHGDSVKKKGNISADENEDDGQMLQENAAGHEYGQSLAFAQIEGRQRTLSDSCLSSFTLSNLGLQPAQLSSSLQVLPIEPHPGAQQVDPIPMNGQPWFWRKNSFDEMSLSFGGFNLGSKNKSKSPGKKNNKPKKNNSKKNAIPIPNSRMYVKNDKIKRKKKAMKTTNS